MTPTKPKFLKRITPKQKQEIREVNQKTMNRLFIGGLIAIVGLATLSIIASLTRSNEPQTIIQETKKMTMLSTTNFNISSMIMLKLTLPYPIIARHKVNKLISSIVFMMWYLRLKTKGISEQLLSWSVESS